MRERSQVNLGYQDWAAGARASLQRHDLCYGQSQSLHVPTTAGAYPGVSALSLGQGGERMSLRRSLSPQRHHRQDAGFHEN
jgi:hypothetical protein